MAEPVKQDGLPQGAKYEAPAPKPKQNPVFRMMGLPNWRLRLPSRNWLIFLSVTGSFAAAITYDRRQKKAAQKKWCDLVAHVAQERLPVNQMPRKLTIFLSSAPGDTIRPSRDYFKEYIKPVLVAAAMDYDVIEGRKEGDVRYGTAEQIRRLRRKRGEKGEKEAEEEMDTENLIAAVRDKMQVEPEPGLRGDLVIGRHTWKEYIRGIHEGWLGPLDEPAAPAPELVEAPLSPVVTSTPDVPAASKPEGAEKPPEDEAKHAEEKKSEEEKKPPFPPSAYLSTSSYSLSPPSAHIPQNLEPSAPIHQQHLLGFLKTPQRIYHFLTRRHLADQIGRETAAIVLAAHRRYRQDETFASTSSSSLDDPTPIATRAPENDAATTPQTTSDPATIRAVLQTSQHWEQQSVLDFEEPTWHKSVHKPKKDKDGNPDKSERVWTDGVVMDPRIAERMRRFELSAEEEDRAQRIGAGLEKTRAVSVTDLRSKKVMLGDIDS